MTAASLSVFLLSPVCVCMCVCNPGDGGVWGLPRMLTDVCRLICSGVSFTRVQITEVGHTVRRRLICRLSTNTHDDNNNNTTQCSSQADGWGGFCAQPSADQQMAVWLAWMWLCCHLLAIIQAVGRGGSLSSTCDTAADVVVCLSVQVSSEEHRKQAKIDVTLP